jgi:hypothetical protein
MLKKLISAMLGLSLLTLANIGQATMASSMPEPTSALPGSSPECRKARDPQRCEALKEAQAACADKRGAEKKSCVQNAMPPADCSKASHPQRCADHQKAKEACKEKSGREYKQCIRQHTPKKKKKSAK